MNFDQMAAANRVYKRIQKNVKHSNKDDIMRGARMRIVGKDLPEGHKLIDMWEAQGYREMDIALSEVGIPSKIITGGDKR